MFEQQLYLSWMEYLTDVIEYIASDNGYNKCVFSPPIKNGNFKINSVSKDNQFVCLYCGDNEKFDYNNLFDEILKKIKNEGYSEQTTKNQIYAKFDSSVYTSMLYKKDNDCVERVLILQINNSLLYCVDKISVYQWDNAETDNDKYLVARDYIDNLKYNVSYRHDTGGRGSHKYISVRTR